ncbi:MAG: hypothetical protein LBC85_12405 [Fibromonadaceae bacterium]|jgi:hypothetical protein|nr:hypothetical protein [Fibromonadaceae bacterium]
MQYFASFNKISLCLLVACALAVISCEKDKPRQIQDIMGDIGYIEPAIEQFIEPTDLTIDYEKALFYNRASEALVVMGQEWAERMAKAETEEKLTIAASYEKAQDELIRKFGIRGKEEYRWIHTKALPNPANKEVFAKAGIWVKY